jgi:HK97 family phage portal protein
VGTDIVWTCIDRNATAVADMPPYMTRNDDLVRMPTPPYIDNPQPEVYSHWGEFVRQIWWSYQAAGEVFIMATSRYSDTDYPRTFLMVAPFLITPEIIDGQRRYFIGSEDVTRDVLHIRYASWPGDARGHGPLEAAGARLLAVRSLMRYGSDLAVNGGIPWAVLKHKYKLGAAQANEMRSQWVQAAHDRAGAPAVLDLDTDLQVLQVSPRDMALSEMQQFAEARIAVLLGVPPFMVGLPSGGDSMTYNTQEGVYVDHWRRTLKPGSGYLMAALSDWLTPGHIEIRLNAASYIRPGDTDRATYYKTMVDLGVLTAADVARMEGLPPPAAAAASSSNPATLEVVA